MFASFTFCSKPGVGQFAGKVEMDCAIEDDILCLTSLAEKGQKTYGFGRLTLKFSKVGDVTGQFTDDAKNVYPFSGKIDDLGNFQGNANLKGRVFNIRAKLAPPSIYRSDVNLKNNGQVIEFLDDHGYRLVVVGRP